MSHKRKRTGIRIYSEKDVDIKLKKAFVDFAKWLRKEYDFPVRIPVYVKKDKYIKNSKGEFSSALFFGPYDKNEEPYIKIATGDFQELINNSGERNAILSILNSLAHEIQHYYQWYDDTDYDEDEAELGAEELIYEYIDSCSV